MKTAPQDKNIPAVLSVCPILKNLPIMLSCADRELFFYNKFAHFNHVKHVDSAVFV